MTLTNNYSIPPYVMLQEVDDETILFNAENGLFFALNEMGTSMWKMMLEHQTLEPVVDDLFEIYDVNKDQLSEDVLNFATILLDNNLLTVS